MRKDTISTLIENLKDRRSSEIKQKIRRIADLESSLLVYGETGVGKDFWVDYLFSVSNFPTILNLNCGDVPGNLLESEWFGYKKGAFTGAERDYEGKWKGAAGGILFLNQVDLLSLNLQSRLLRIIERKKFFPLGSNREEEIDVRFIFSTDHDIEEKVKTGKFRQDLFYRISAYSIFVPPIRERKKDILPLLYYFAGQRGLTVDLGQKAVRTLLNYPWDGNIREIENFVNNASVTQKVLTDQALDILVKDSHQFFQTQQHTEMPLQELQREYISFLLRKYRSKVKVAQILGISRKSLYNKLKKYDKD
jgi:transcriptional regulator with PAS, ATPase and Fis domain